MIMRRTAILGLASSIQLARTGSAQDVDPDELIRRAQSDTTASALGAKLLPPSSKLWSEAKDEMAKAAAKKIPIEIVSNFVNSLPAELQTNWPGPAATTFANPLIVLLFTATNLKPAGDTTAWCAACVGWCLNNASPRIQGTDKANAVSYLNWGTEVWHQKQPWPPANAKRGDVAVFRHRSDPGHGHVTFYDKPTHGQPHAIDVCGGNQFNRAGLHTFNVSSLNIQSDLKLVSIRTSNGLRNA